MTDKHTEAPAEHGDAHAEAHGAAKEAHGTPKEAHGATKEQHGAAKEGKKAADDLKKAAESAHTEAAKAHADHGHEAHAAPAHGKEHSGPHVELSTLIYDHVRNPMRKLLWAGVIGVAAALPTVSIPTYIGKKILDVTVAKAPLIGKPYKAISNIATDIPNKIANAIATVPYVPVHAAEEVVEGALNMRRPDTSGVGRVFEAAYNGVGSVLRGSVSTVGTVLGKCKNAVSWTFGQCVDLVKHVVPMYVKHPVLAPLVTMGIIGGIYQLGGVLPASVAIWSGGMTVVEGLGATLKGLGTWL